MGPLRRLLETPAGNRRAAAALLVLVVLLFAVLRLGSADAVLTDGLILVLVLVVVPALTWSGLLFLSLPARIGWGLAALTATGVYALLGVATAIGGIPGYIDPVTTEAAPSLGGRLSLALGWPWFWLWLHECALGVGLWSCPSG